jgi:molecular chaperone DnaK (HSP70)
VTNVIENAHKAWQPRNRKLEKRAIIVVEITAVAEKIGLVQKESKRKHVTGNPEKCLQRKLNAVMKFAMQASCHSWNRNVPTSHYLDTHFYPLLIRSQPDSQPIILNNLTGHGSTKI